MKRFDTPSKNNQKNLIKASHNKQHFRQFSRSNISSQNFPPNLIGPTILNHLTSVPILVLSPIYLLRFFESLFLVSHHKTRECVRNFELHALYDHRSSFQIFWRFIFKIEFIFSSDLSALQFPNPLFSNMNFIFVVFIFEHRRTIVVSRLIYKPINCLYVSITQTGSTQTACRINMKVFLKD